MITVALLLLSVPQLFLNHLFVTVDPPVWQSIKKSVYVQKTFALFDSETVHSGKDSWTGIYVNGLNTYIEIFTRPRAFPRQDVGLGFMTMAFGGADDAYSEFHRLFGDRAERMTRMQGKGANEHPWFHMADYGGSKDFFPWVMELDAGEYKDAGVPYGSSYYKLMCGWDHKKAALPRIMKEVSQITLRLPKEARADFEKALPALGWHLDAGKWKLADQAFVLLDGPKTEVVEVSFSVRQKTQKAHVERFGPHCVLSVNPSGRAVWRFSY